MLTLRLPAAASSARLSGAVMVWTPAALLPVLEAYQQTMLPWSIDGPVKQSLLGRESGVVIFVLQLLPTSSLAPSASPRSIAMFGLGLLQQLWRLMWSRLQSLLGVSWGMRSRSPSQSQTGPEHCTNIRCGMQESSGTTLTLTGILGLAAVVYALYQLRGGQGELRTADGAG